MAHGFTLYLFDLQVPGAEKRVPDMLTGDRTTGLKEVSGMNPSVADRISKIEELGRDEGL